MPLLQRFTGSLLLAGGIVGCGDQLEAPSGSDAELAPAVATAAVYTQVVVGGVHTCALASNGLTYCWGAGAAIGGGSVFQSSTPVRVVRNLRFVQISAGSEHTCGVTADNRAYCWGENFLGQIGDGTHENSRSAPVLVAGGHRFRQVRAGGHHTCAIDLDGKLFCWGDNLRGELGVGDLADRLVPTRVLGGLTVQRVIAGYEHNCAVTAAGKGYCWGRNLEGELGNNSTVSRPRPVPVSGGLSFKQIVAGSQHTCAVTTASKAYCWGAVSDYNNGELGTGGFVGSLVPVAVAGTRQWRQVNAGYFHTCGVTLANVAFCWGFNFHGQNGDGTNTGTESPTRVVGNIPFLGIAVGVYDPSPFATSFIAIHTCGITTDGRVFCWGGNADGQFGIGTRNSSLTPVEALPPT